MKGMCGSWNKHRIDDPDLIFGFDVRLSPERRQSIKVRAGKSQSSDKRVKPTALDVNPLSKVGHTVDPLRRVDTSGGERIRGRGHLSVMHMYLVLGPLRYIP